MAHYETPEGKSIYIDGYLLSNLQHFKKMVLHDDLDCIILVDGGEGAGKSVLAQQIAKFLDPSFGVGDICFSGSQFKKAVINAEKYKCIVFDEALSALNKMKSISSLNVSVVDLLAEVRQKNLFIIIILPSFFDLTKNVACWRSRALFHVYMKGEKFQRGFFNAYSYDKKLNLFIGGKKYYNYHCASPSFYGRFTNGYTVDETEYRKLKLTNLRAYAVDEDVEENKVEKRYRFKLFRLVDTLLEKGIMTRTEVGELVEMGSTALKSFLHVCGEDFVGVKEKEELEAIKLNRKMKEEFSKIQKKDKSFDFDFDKAMKSKG